MYQANTLREHLDQLQTILQKRRIWLVSGKYRETMDKVDAITSSCIFREFLTADTASHSETPILQELNTLYLRGEEARLDPSFWGWISSLLCLIEWFAISDPNPKKVPLQLKSLAIQFPRSVYSHQKLTSLLPECFAVTPSPSWINIMLWWQHVCLSLQEPWTILPITLSFYIGVRRAVSGKLWNP